MTEARQSPYAPRVISEGDIPVHKDLGEVAQTRRVGVPRPMPGIVILVHGVNDVGEAYQNQEKGILAGLSKRLNRQDFYAHEWGEYRIAHPGRSPVIPFYWGYKPVTHEDYQADQKRYREEVYKQGDNAHLPFDAYQEDNEKNKAALGNDGKGAFKYQNDNFKNALDTNFAKGGGTFANATTNIPDMLGPGAGGAALAAAGFATLHMNGGDYTHPIFPNPHRIYQFFAAQRLTDLILQIRQNPVTKTDVINVVAHSQGTIITMLANMLVMKQGEAPVNCTILNHSPYSLEGRLSEDAQPGHHQTAFARQETFKHFCALMATQYKGGELSEADMLAMEASCAARKSSDNPLRKDARYRRDNNGKVYNYWCPQDGTVSLQNIQGFGWRGIPDELAAGIPNLRQRVFCQHRWVGRMETEPFKMAPERKGDFSTTPVMNAGYSYSDVVINGEELPEPFIFKLMGQDNHPDNDPKTSDKPYTAYIDPNSPDAYISYSAIRAVTWPGNKHVDSSFLVDAVIIPVAAVTFLVQAFCMAYNAHRHYIETRILIAARQEYKVVSYARRNIILAGWSILTPPKATKELALNMLKLEGEFPLAAKMPLKIDLDKSFDFTRAGQAIIHVLEPMMEKLSRYKQIEALVWVRGGDESSSDELRRVLERSGISIKKITFLPECPDYTLVTEWIKQTNGCVVERLLICVDLHSEEGECKWMENATALFLTNYYVKTEGEKPVYVYQPMTGVIDVERAVPVYLRAEVVSKPKQIWYTGLSRTEKYPLLEVLDEKKVVPDRLELEKSLGEHSAGYPWLALVLASDAVTYAQGDQFVAASEQKKFSITAVSSRLTHQPDYPVEKMYTPPWSSAGISGMMLFFAVILTICSFSGNDGKDISGWFLVITFVICTGLFTAAGVFITWLQGDKAYQHMGM